jgi:hypothetical protein
MDRPAEVGGVDLHGTAFLDHAADFARVFAFSGNGNPKAELFDL